MTQLYNKLHKDFKHHRAKYKFITCAARNIYSNKFKLIRSYQAALDTQIVLQPERQDLNHLIFFTVSVLCFQNLVSVYQ